MKYSAEGLGAAGWIAVLYTMIKFHPIPFRNLNIGALSVALIAMPLAEKFVMQFGGDEGWKLEYSKLNKEIFKLRDENSSIRNELASFVGNEGFNSQLASLHKEISKLRYENRLIKNEFASLEKPDRPGPVRIERIYPRSKESGETWTADDSMQFWGDPNKFYSPNE